MWDIQCQADERDMQEARDEVNAMKADIIHCIEEMDAKTFRDWYEQHCREIQELVTRRFAAATLYHEEPCF